MNHPDFLYKYQSLNEYSLASLENSTIWLAKPATFNDPFDCAITLDRKKYKQSVMHAVTVALERGKPTGSMPEHLYDLWPGDREAFEQFRSDLSELVQKIGICSFSATPNHLLMWSHYAAQHRGFCVQYDCREGTGLRRFAKKVKYEDIVPSLSAADFVPQGNGDAVDTLWLTKAKCWSYEEEWRVMAPNGNQSYQAPSDIVSVIFGARMSEQDRSMVIRALRHQSDIEFKEARLKEGHFAIELFPCESLG